MHKPDGSLGRIGWRHEAAQSLKHLLELGAGVVVQGVMLLGQRLGLVFQLAQPLEQVAMRGGQFPQLNEGPHDIDRHFDSSRAVEDGRGHQGPVFGEHPWGVSASTPSAV